MLLRSTAWLAQVPEHTLRSPFVDSLAAIPVLQGTQESHQGLAQWEHESLQAKYSELSSCNCWDFVSAAPSLGLGRPPHCHTSGSVENASPACRPPHLQPGALWCLYQPGLGGVTGRSASISRFWISWLFCFLTTLQSRSPAPLPPVFELLQNKADTIL